MKAEDALSITYQIGTFIQTLVSEDIDDPKKPYGRFSGHFEKGPNPCYNQTQKGLVLEKNNSVYKIHTPLGSWTILGSTCDKQNKVFKSIQTSLGLEFLQDKTSSHWAITKWNDKEIERPIYKREEKFMPYEQVNKVWKEFASKHKDLT